MCLTTSEIEQLKEASRLVKDPIACTCAARTVRFDIDLPPYGVLAVTMSVRAGRPGDPDARHHSICS